jgi:omega-amidase
MKVNITLFQINTLFGKFKENFATVLKTLNNLKVKNNHFVLLPELWLTGYSYSEIFNAAKFISENINVLKDITKSKNFNLIGSVPWLENNKLFNRNLIINNRGELKGYYDKIHLFKPLLEHKYFFPGNKPIVIEITDIKAGIMLCYDIRFPELSRKLMLNGAEILFVSAQWPIERIEQWILLNRARAIENQLFVAACNGIGKGGNIQFGGNSLVVSPKGELLLQLNENEELSAVEIYLSEIEDSKKLFNIKNDIKLIQGEVH